MASAASLANASAKTQQKINAAIASKGATGTKGFLLWVQAAFPKSVSAPILSAAQGHQISSRAAMASSPITAASAMAKGSALTGFGRLAGTMRMGRATRFGRLAGPTTASRLNAMAARARIGKATKPLSAFRKDTRSGMGSFGRFGRLSRLGQTGATGMTVPAGYTAPAGATGSTGGTSAMSGTLAATLATVAGAAISTANEIQNQNAAQTLIQENLGRAQRGLGPVALNPVAVGAVGAGESNPLLVLGFIAAAIWIVAEESKKH